MIFIYAITTESIPYFLLLLIVAVVGFFICFFNVCKPKAEGEVRKAEIKVEKVKVNIKQKAMEASKLYEKMHFKKVYDVLELDLTKDDSKD